jgi:gamma-glutamyltranspeptidase/glutathione hydrolase
MNGLSVLTVLWLLPLLINSSALAVNGGGDREVGEWYATRSPIVAQSGMAATSHPLASHIAIQILERGGTAVDAAIAANAALGLMEPTGCGVGGDLFAIVWDPKSAKLHGLNASGRSPAGLSLAEMRERLGDQEEIPYVGVLPVTVPGAVDGWFELHGKFGRLPMTEILAPAIRYAKQGFPITQVIGAGLALNLMLLGQYAEQIEEFDNARGVYMPGGRAPSEGEIFRNPDLARTYERIAEGGRDAFYRGEIARVIDAYMRRIGGYLRKEDLAAHESIWVEPLSTSYRGYQVYELPPNAQGIAVLQILNIIEAYDLAAMGHNSADALHVMTEAKKLVYADRARFYADPDFYAAPVEGLLSKAYAAERRKLIDMSKAREAVEHGDPKLEGGDTIYLTVADGEGMMVSLIQSNFAGLGAGLVPDGLGFMHQNRGQLFSLEDGHPNLYAPGKRPFHTIIPAFVLKDGVPFLSFGVMGGAQQPQGQVQVLVNLIDFGMNVQEAGDAARFNHAESTSPTRPVVPAGGLLRLENGVDEAVAEELRRRGHNVKVEPGDYGGYQAIMWDPVNRVYHGASEMRKDGVAIGY